MLLFNTHWYLISYKKNESQYFLFVFKQLLRCIQSKNKLSVCNCLYSLLFLSKFKHRVILLGTFYIKMGRNLTLQFILWLKLSTASTHSPWDLHFKTFDLLVTYQLFWKVQAISAGTEDLMCLGAREEAWEKRRMGRVQRDTLPPTPSVLWLDAQELALALTAAASLLLSSTLHGTDLTIAQLISTHTVGLCENIISSGMPSWSPKSELDPLPFYSFQ